MRFSILGPLVVHGDDGAALPIGGTRLRRLLVLLLLSPGRTVRSERLVRGIWADEPAPVSAGNALQALASRLRRALGPSAPLHGDPTGYRLDVDPRSVDLVRFEDLADQGRRARAEGDPATAAARLAEALELWRGPALADLSGAGAGGADDVAVRLAESRRGVELDLLTLRLDLHGADSVLPDIEAAAAREPHAERPVELLMRALAGAGRQADALAAYDRLRRALADDLGIDPSPQIQRLHVRLLRGELTAPAPPAPRRETPPPPPAPPRPAPVKRLPHHLTSFIAREDELTRVRDLLARERLVTLIGPGGAGKTRLSIEAGARFVEDHADLAAGVWFVELAPLREGADIPHALLAALGLGDSAAMTVSSATAHVPAILDRVVDFIGRQDLLVVMDNCEHLVAETAQVAERLLAACPGLRILATSREPLGIAGERLLGVPSLELPPEDTPADRAGDYASVRLFAERARAVLPEFTVDPANAEHVVRVCRELDGLPLALELAAARLRAMPLAHLAARLSDRFRILTNGSRFALPQHQTLQAVVDWSWELLDDTERTLLRRLSVFAGGATLDAVEAVCDLRGGPDVWSVLFALVDKSLVIADVPEDSDSEPRYRMLETVRAYGAQRLAESGEEPALRRALAHYVRDLFREADPHLRGPEQLAWLTRLRQEHDNLTAALRWAVAERDTDLALDLVAGSAWYWQMVNTWTDLVRWCGEILDLVGDRVPPGRAAAYAQCLTTSVIGDQPALVDTAVKSLLRAEEILLEAGDHTEDHPALFSLPLLLGMLGYDPAARLARLDTVAQTHPDPWTRACARLFGGLLASHQGRGAQGREWVMDGLARYRAIGDRWGIAHALTCAADVVRYSDPQREHELLTEGGRLADELHLPGLATVFRVRRAVLMAARGAVAEARRELAVARGALPDPETRVFLRVGEADVARLAGDPLAADQHLADLTAAVQDMSEVMRTQVEPLVQVRRARTAMALGRTAEARTRVAAAWDTLNPFIGEMHAAEVLEALAEVLAGAAPERAAVVLGYAEAVRGLPNDADPEVARCRRRARDLLGADEFDRAYAQGSGADRATMAAQVAGWLAEWRPARPAGPGTPGA
ncbi:AfsR/SARP family transcriptional regulator [Streptomonospora sp. S1-112]|uniref:AfsR/SARP family transcriptional regulator n=1 Tax=Streptomonospora mangrovi TaxID=2883123 RepID=A0A9X3NR14_9ACTN|nr:BTAD domain-containing putative transcriptional regulator [Streptomonospora mangrovi]MDA0566424.1 AfsR/SARP family transcriptional regulator [Streptomonospora mangrovi]